MSTKLKIGIFGFGVVGQGLHDIIRGQDLNLEIIKIAIKNPNKKRSLDSSLFTTDHDEILDNPDINTIVELIDDADAAFKIVKKALSTGKHVVSANKKMIANHLEELVKLQELHGTSLLYEGAVCGSIPIIRNLEEYYDNELLHGISGIFNGSSNYILSKIFNENMPYDVALKQAQDLGFAETDPIMDVGGYDPKFKLAIATAHAYGLFIDPDKILNVGIQNLSEQDIQYAREKNFKIKLVPTARKISTKQVITYVLPKFVKSDDFLYNVENEYNGVTVQAAFADKQFFFGKGAGGHPTGAAVLSDIAALRYGYKYEYKKFHQHNGLIHTDQVNIEVYLRYTHEYTVEKLKIENILERFVRNDYKYVIGSVSLKSLLANRDLLQQKDVFIAHTGRYTYTDQQIQVIAGEEVSYN
ncbi:homoserine dehydrogenase [Pedobacter antarcticus 4BY]|uniref:Homoserine dehydrogenase n=2 Tax=Pedobacter antarcticus TaxID=34086 RepID=A0A081PD34_9SPHI|nr:homoserine dehydrogenase [Pedobacter antarcticus]KEQ28607.1 homoserine dehydrogenase [Pedobacter antarcticus 4BY]SFE36944.1 homoserine dehydrogenase [Pedobacter antarcticus]